MKTVDESKKNDDVNVKLQKLASKQPKWNKTVTPAQKLAYLDDALSNLTEKVGLSGLKDLGEATADMKGVSTAKEREYIDAEEIMIVGVTLKGYLEALRETYRVRAGISELDDFYKNIPLRKVGDHVVADVFPLTEADKAGPRQAFKGEIWFDPDYIKNFSDVKPFQFDYFSCKKDGAMVVLGAGNYTVLTVLDCLYALFIKNQVVFVKQHPLRPWLDSFMRQIFSSLYEHGYLDSEPDQGRERSAQIVYSPHVTALHMTGGKRTHDAIVFGSTEEEQAENKANHTLKLQNATITSELGCVTPFIMTNADYTSAELEHQAQVIASAKWINGSASCNAPQVVLIADSWPQRQEFASKLANAWTTVGCAACTYYPGAEERWNAFHAAYPDAKIIHNNSGKESDEKNLYLPLLLSEVEVDLSTEAGRQKASTEYAFKNEVFTPALVITTIKDKEGNFMNQAVNLANSYLYGSLSCSISVPSSVTGSDCVEEAIAQLKYGSIVLNAWSAQSYSVWSLGWGAFGCSGDPIENVQSGVGKVVNALALPHIEKSVCRTPIIDEANHFLFTKPLEDIIAADMSAAEFVLSH